jgi:predicted nucleotidyltransferase component of viral defense system
MERFLYRLSVSKYAEDFILKGAFMLRVWNFSEYRPTMDIDMLGISGNDQKYITEQIRDILAVEIEPDGLIFDADTIQAEQINDEADYEGVRITFRGTLGTAKIRMQIDIGFGDVIYPGPEKKPVPCILDFPAPSLLCYSRESVIAEKFEAMIQLGLLNSRMKDFYDIWLLSRQFGIDVDDVTEAVKRTLSQRKTKLYTPIDAFSAEFVSLRQPMWAAFRKRLKQDYVPELFQEVVDDIALFLAPVITAYMQGFEK